MNSIIAECEQLAHRIAPELAEHPLYTLTAPEVPWLKMPEDCRGFALPHGAIGGIREVLGERWQGPGPAIVLAVQERPLMLRTMLHEVAHVLPSRETFISVNSPPIFMEFQCRVLNDGLAEPAEPPMDAPDNWHDWRFIRRALHLFFRASAIGYHDIPIYDLFRGWFMSQEPHWLCELLPELQAVPPSCRFAEIEQREPPSGFMALWEHSVSFSLKHYKP
jgi:hypothetical protein